MLVLDFGFGGGGRGMYTRQFSDGGSKSIMPRLFWEDFSLAIHRQSVDCNA